MNRFRPIILPAWCIVPGWLFIVGSVILWFALPESADTASGSLLPRWGWAQIALLFSCAAAGGMLRFQIGQQFPSETAPKGECAERAWLQSCADSGVHQEAATFTLARDGTVKSLSTAFAGMIGHTSGRWIGRKIDELLLTTDRQPVGSLFARVLNGNPPPSVTATTHTNGHLLELECTAVPESSKGSASDIQVLARKVTERDGVQEKLRQAERMEFIGQLAAGVAHDFNNILTIQQSYASELAELPGLPDEARLAVREITAAGERAAILTRKLLAFGRQQTMQPRHLHCGEFLRGMRAEIGQLLGDDITCTLNAEAPLPLIYVDDAMLEQVVTILVSNAHDAMPDGGAVVISAESVDLPESTVLRNPEARPGSFVVLTVSDTGCGISPQNLHRIFEPFFTTKDVARGAGLGLPTVHGIVKQNDGWIEVESRVHAGTTFRIYLPAVQAPPPPGKAPVTKVDAAETILVVEDETQLCTVVGRFLKRKGYNVLMAESGNEAIRLWEKHHGQVDLLLTDLVMPEGMTGRELADRLLARQPDLKVLYTSGYSSEFAGRDLSIQSGFNFLPKPYQPAELAKVVRACLDNG